MLLVTLAVPHDVTVTLTDAVTHCETLLVAHADAHAVPLLDAVAQADTLPVRDAETDDVELVDEDNVPVALFDPVGLTLALLLCDTVAETVAVPDRLADTERE